MKRLLVLMYGLFAYTVGMGSLVCLMGWLGNFLVPRPVDSEPTMSLGVAALINAALFAVFAIQHSVMARPAFKDWWTRFVPRSIERSTYVLLSGLAMMLIVGFWQPMGIVIWDVRNSAGQFALYGLFAIGWVILVGSTFILNHFDLFGLRQVWLRFRGKPYTHLDFATPGPYRMVRHPLYVGWITLAWATPTMTIAHLGFAVAATAYILFAIQLEERDLVEFHGESYVKYRERTPMLIPRLGRPASPESAQAG